MKVIENVLVVVLLIATITACKDSQPPSISDRQPSEITPESKFAQLTRQAQTNNASAQFDLGMMYETGDGTPKNAAQAVEWFQKSATQGNAKAQAALGRMYRDGDGVIQDYAKALDWLQKSADQGIPRGASESRHDVQPG